MAYALITIGDQIVFHAGNHIIDLQWAGPDAYHVSTRGSATGGREVPEWCTSAPEDTARAFARWVTWEAWRCAAERDLLGFTGDHAVAVKAGDRDAQKRLLAACRIADAARTRAQEQAKVSRMAYDLLHARDVARTTVAA